MVLQNVRFLISACTVFQATGVPIYILGIKLLVPYSTAGCESLVCQNLRLGAGAQATLRNQRSTQTEGCVATFVSVLDVCPYVGVCMHVSMHARV